MNYPLFPFNWTFWRVGKNVTSRLRSLQGNEAC